MEPVTGTIVKQVSEQTRLIDTGEPFLALKLAYTDAQVKQDVQKASDNVDNLNLVRVTVPIISLILGLLLLIPGLLLWRRDNETTQRGSLIKG